MNKKVTAIGLSAGLLAGLGAGVLLEHSGGASAERAGINVVPMSQGGTNSETPMMGGDTSSSVESVIQGLVDDGTLTQAQADKVLAALQQAGVGPSMGGFPGDGDGDGGRGGRGMGGLGDLDGVAALLGISTTDLRTALANGQTLAQIAEANGATAQQVIDLLVQAVKDHFAPEVASGEHTQEEADAMIAAATQQITDFVNNGGALGGRGIRPGDGDGDHGAFPGDDQGGDDNGSGQGGSIDGGPSDAPTTSADA